MCTRITPLYLYEFNVSKNIGPVILLTQTAHHASTRHATTHLVCLELSADRHLSFRVFT